MTAMYQQLWGRHSSKYSSLITNIRMLHSLKLQQLDNRVTGHILEGHQHISNAHFVTSSLTLKLIENPLLNKQLLASSYAYVCHLTVFYLTQSLLASDIFIDVLIAIEQQELRIWIEKRNAYTLAIIVTITMTLNIDVNFKQLQCNLYVICQIT